MKKSIMLIALLSASLSAQAETLECTMVEKDSTSVQKIFTSVHTAELDTNGDALIVERNRHFDVGTHYGTSIAVVEGGKIEEVRVVLNDGWGVRSSGEGQRKKVANVEMGHERTVGSLTVSFSSRFACRIIN